MSSEDDTEQAAGYYQEQKKEGVGRSMRLTLRNTVEVESNQVDVDSRQGNSDSLGFNPLT